MNPSILDTEVQQFINDNLEVSITKLALSSSPFDHVTTKELLDQISSKHKAKTKLPTWFNKPGIYYPNKLNIEQTSSEDTALYKSKLVSGETIIDITGGFGVDSYFFSKIFNRIIHCEINNELHNIAKHNFKVLNKLNITTICEDGISYLSKTDQTFDCIYVDPSRRHDAKGKVFMLKDCFPNIPESLDVLFTKTKQILIKTSPILDIHLGLSELKNVASIHVVAVNNEVKELLWLLDYNATQNPKVYTINIKPTSSQNFDFYLQDERLCDADYSLPLTYLYEPNAAILKAGAFKSIAKTTGVFKLHQHSHLYTSQDLTNFPGRIFTIKQVVIFNKTSLKSLHLKKANITTRNFPMDVQAIRKKFKITDGGNNYLFFTTLVNNEKVILICEKTVAPEDNIVINKG